MAQPLSGSDDPSLIEGGAASQGARGSSRRPPPAPAQAAVGGQGGGEGQGEGRGEGDGASPRAQVRGGPGGRAVGTFRNTYYDFPREADYSGGSAKVMNGACSPIASVPRGFFEAVCVQGSGTLRDGTTVSFARRDCECADVCPRTGQRICFEPLDRQRFPWGRGAMGTAITPLRTVAVDSEVVPLGTALYIAEYDGLPLGEGEGEAHDGCFVAQDRGTKVKGQHVDIFTGHERTTVLWNRLVPSNKGVTVYVDHPRCK